MPLSTIPSAGLDSQAQFIGFKNRIINGDMRIAQRGTSFTVGSAAYTLDRWQVYGSGASVAAAQVSGPTGFKNALQITGAASVTQAGIFQRIESNNVTDLSGQTVTASVNIFASTTQTVLWQLLTANATDNFTSTTTIASGTWPITTTATTYTATIPNLPASVLNGLQLSVYPNNAGAFTSGTLTVTGVQLERGNTATSFEVIDYGRQLIQCQRYYEVLNYATSSYAALSAMLTSTANSRHTWYFKATKRAAPTAGLVTGAWQSQPNMLPSISHIEYENTTYFYAFGTAGNAGPYASAEL